jgi:hypothetical protein
MNLINGLSSIFLIISAIHSIKTNNFLWIFANFYIIYTSFMYNIHKFDLYYKYPNNIISMNDLSDTYDVYLFNDYIAVSLLAFVNIDNLIIKNFIFVSFFIEYYYYKSIANSNSIIFFVGIISRSLKTFNTHKKFLINKQIIFTGLLNIINACFTLIIRYKYAYTRETQLLNVILTTIWHYNVINILCFTSSCIYYELKYNKNKIVFV